MKVPFLDLSAQFEMVGSSVTQQVLEVLSSTQYILGPKVEELEQKISEYSGCRFGVGVTSGTDALLVALMALGLKAGDLVLTTPHSFFATAGVISRLGGRPVFVDIDPATFNISPERLQSWLLANRQLVSKVKAIVPVHLFGQMADMEPIMECAQKYGIPVIEDAAQAIGATYPSATGPKKAGSMGLAGCLSFFPSKNLGAVGDAGMVVTNDQKFAEKVRLLRVHGSKPKYFHREVGGNFRLAPIQAAALLAKFPFLESWHERRRQNAAYYDQALASMPITPPKVAYGRADHVYNQYVITVGASRDHFKKSLAEAEVGTEVYYPCPFHLQECFRDLDYSKGDFPVAEEAANHTLAIPIYPELTESMQAWVVEVLRRCTEKFSR